MTTPLRLRVDPADPMPVYEQVRSQLERLIASGQLEPGRQLPTIRQLAGDLGLAKATVSRVYEGLEREGFIVTRGRHGTTVAERRRALPKAARTGKLREAAERFALDVAQLGVSVEDAESAIAAALERLR